MYCIKCGFKLPEEAKFCPNCGNAQEIAEPTEKEIRENEIVRQPLRKHQNLIDYVDLRKAVGWYLAWVILHLGLLLIGSDGIFKSDNMGANRFWPFGGISDFDDLEYYDVTEFLVYTVFPLAILFIFNMIRNNTNEPTRE